MKLEILLRLIENEKHLGSQEKSKDLISLRNTAQTLTTEYLVSNAQYVSIPIELKVNSLLLTKRYQ